MKKIEAIIKPYKLEEVRDALGDVGLAGMTVTEVRGYGREKANSEFYPGGEYPFDFLPKVRIELVVSDSDANAAVAAVVKGARTGKLGDGKIFVAHIEQAVRIRTDEKDEQAV